MDKQIEELAKDLQESWMAWSLSVDLPQPWEFVAEILAKKRQPKIPEGAVVLTREEWEHRAYLNAMQNDLCKKCRKEIGERLVSKDECEYWKSRVKEIGDIAYEQARKETAEKFADRLKEKLEENIPFEEYDLEDFEFDGETIQEFIDEICKELVDE